MKSFEVPAFYRSPIISKIKAMRKAQDPRKKDFSPTKLELEHSTIFIARHFGFCYGVENAIEIAYRAIAENPGKRILLLSQMIHNPGVNEDLIAHGLEFIQDTKGKQLIAWDEIKAEDIVIIPAFGTTLEIEQILTDKGVEIQQYNTTCPFVEKVWNRSEKLANDAFNLVIHGKYSHEETRATFSHTTANTQAVIVKDMKEAEYLADVMRGKVSKEDFYRFFEGKYSVGFDPEIHLSKLGVINQTTMLATETQAIAEFLKGVSEEVAFEKKKEMDFADTRDTLCYATNDNQSATLALADESLDLAIVVGGYNSSNTTHLVEILEEKMPVYFVKDAEEILSAEEIRSFDYKTGEISIHKNWLSDKKDFKIGFTSGASCPDATIDAVISKVFQLRKESEQLEELMGYI